MDRLQAIRKLVPMPENERGGYNISNLKVGGYFNFRDQNWVVTRICKYLDVKWKDFSRRKRDEWVYELTIMSLKTGEQLFIEYYEDDGIEVYITTEELKMSALGVSKGTLEQIADQEEGVLFYKDKAYNYVDDETAAMLYFTSDDDEGVPVRLYEFEAEDGTCLTVEAWYADVDDDRPSREAFISEPVANSDIHILQLS